MSDPRIESRGEKGWGEGGRGGGGGGKELGLGFRVWGLGFRDTVRPKCTLFRYPYIGI